MIQELATLCMSDIVQLLGALGLLSLGITLTLWGLKRRRSGAVVIVLFLSLVALLPVALAIEIPSAGSVAQIQTSGPNALLGGGDWYASRNPDAGGPGYHDFEIFVPCSILPTQMITVELFDPELWYDGTADEVDEIRDGTAAHNRTNDNADADNATFVLFDPSRAQVVRRTYVPSIDTSGVYTTFASFSVGTYGGCGIYTVTATTSDDDDNAWKLRVMPDDPDGQPGTGDEISLGNLRTSYQNEELGCQTFHFFVPDVPSILLSNFDMDLGVLCDDLTCTVVYTTPNGTSITDTTVSGGTEWSGGGTDYPPSQDVITNPESGWWQARLCLNENNQYVFDPGLTYFDYKPDTPDMTVSKDDGTATFEPDVVLDYTIIYINDGPGAALDAMLTDTLPLSTTFVSCTPLDGESCGYIPPPPGSGIVTFSLGTIRPGESGSVAVSVRVDAGVPTGTITNTVELDYTDIVFSDYPVETDIDVDQYEALTPNPGIGIAKTVYLGHDSGVGCPGSEIVIDVRGADVTYCFEVTNTGNTYLDSIVITDTLLGIPPAAVVLLSGATPLAPGNRLVYYYEGTVSGDLVNTAQTEGNPTDSNGNDLEGLDNPTAAYSGGAAYDYPHPAYSGDTYVNHRGLDRSKVAGDGWFSTLVHSCPWSSSHHRHCWPVESGFARDERPARRWKRGLSDPVDYRTCAVASQTVGRAMS